MTMATPPSAQKRVFITRSILSDGAEWLRAHGLQVDVHESDVPLSKAELTVKAQDYDALITMLSDEIDESFLEHNPQLKIVANYAVGFNNIDTTAAKKRGVAVTNTPDVLTEATAETALGLMIAAARQFKEASKTIPEGTWKTWGPKKHLGLALKGKTLGIVGFGRIGIRLAEMAHYAFGMKILYTAHSPKEAGFPAQKVTLKDLLTESDMVSLHVPLKQETRGLIGARELSWMKPTAVLVNTARGEIVDQDALVQALAKGQIFAAGLDVMTPEPLPLESPLMSLPNVFLLPHIGSATFEARRAMALLCAENVLAALTGKELLTPVGT